MEISHEHSETIEGQVVEEVYAFQWKVKTDKSTKISCFVEECMKEQKTKSPALGKRCKKLLLQK